MSEVQSRPAAARGRGSGRGGRGGLSTRGGRSATRTNGDSAESSSLPSLEDEGEIGQLKKQYGSKVAIIKEMFPDWSDVDVLFALNETDGDESLAVTRIAEGTISQWGEVTKPKKVSKPKTKTDTFTSTPVDSFPGSTRPARGGRVESGRGRGRATERGGRGGGRGKPLNATINGHKTMEGEKLSIPTEEANVWGTPKPTEEASAWPEESSPSTETPAAAPAPVAPKPVEPAQKTWASMLRQSVPKPAPKPKEVAPPKPAEPVIEPLPPVAEPTPVEPEVQAEPEAAEPEVPTPVEEPTPEPVKKEATPPPPPPPPPAVPALPIVPIEPALPAIPVVPEVALEPPKDQLTETNLEQVADDSHPPQTETVASEAADSWDPRAQPPSATATPNSASQQQHQTSRVPGSGFATTASKATDRTSTRTPTYARRILDQQEPVRMPGNRDQVDRAAVQFGAFSLNEEDDIDGDREEPETRPQPPQDSPVTQPRASLPPVQPAPVPETFAAQKPAASLPPTGPAATTTTAPPTAPTQPAAAAAASQGAYYLPISSLGDDSLKTPAEAASQPPTAPATQQFGRFGQPAPQEPASFGASKPFDAFGQQPGAMAAQTHYETGFPGQGQAAQTPNQQQPVGAFSSAPSDYSQYYTADQSRYNYYGQNNFGQQQGAQGQQDGLSQPQRGFGYNAPQADNLSQYPQSGAQHAQTRFGSGSDMAGTPTPNQVGTQAQTAQTTQAQTHGQQQPHDQYGPYGSHPYYSNPYYSAYMNYNGYNQGAYGAPYGKGNLGYQPNQYGMSPQAPHGYASSPAGFGQSTLHRETGVGAGGLNDYGRTASGQTAQQQGLGGSGFGGMHDAFGRGGSSYQSQAGQSFNAPGTQPGAGPSASDDLKPFGDSKAASGPSPALGGAARPGSATNNAPSQSGLPPPQSNQQSGLGGMGSYGYPNHLQGHGLHSNQQTGTGYGMGATGSQGHQNTYGSYAGQGFGGGYYGNPPRGGWGNNYH
ncbi:hypothetical protein QBC45DRAFT_152672 [Copromyces sp. CBS 386.78]|nr:hypothetical protein QBC45DRAFT_152672 [Copromyces sp. CBS 386.78]